MFRTTENHAFKPITIKIDEGDWYSCGIQDNDFLATCGPHNLLSVLKIFKEWAKLAKKAEIY